MKFLYSPKIWLWQIHTRRRGRKKGLISLIAIFTLFVFSVLGLGMLYLSQVHLKFSAYRKNSVLLDYASENGIKQEFTRLISLLSEASSPSLLTPEEMDDLREDALQNGIRLVEKLLGPGTRFHHSVNWENLSWQTRIEFSIKKVAAYDDYFKVSCNASIFSKGKIKNFPPTRESSLECIMEIPAGNLPLPQIPLLIDKRLSHEERKEFIEENKIEISLSEDNKLSPQIAFSEQLIPEEAHSQLMKALKIKMFYPQNLSRSQLRHALGLEESNEPVPDGVYLIKDDLGLGGVFIQGDLEEMILAVEEDSQVISLHTEGGHWTLKFSPAKGKTMFSTPQENHFYDLIPLGIIIVNGKIQSLGGGIVEPSGQMILVKDREVPSILQGVNLTIISSEKITITSHLLHQGLKWQEGVPYLKDSQSQLIIFATGKDFMEDTEREGEIVIEGDSSQELIIQASLTASGKGVSIEGKGKTIQILGSLQATELNTNKNTLKITFDERLPENDYLLQNAPKTTKPVLYLSSFKPTQWKEY